MAMRSEDALLQEIRDRNPILDVVGDYVSLKRAGNRYVGLCPFHSEKSPSFGVSPDRQFFYCFGCQTGGDVISFVRELHGYSFPEAVRHLAERAGIAVPEHRYVERKDGGASEHGGRVDPQTRKRTKDAYYQVGRVAQAYFEESLQALIGTRCREYLASRGVSAETVERFALGFAPDAWEGLAHHLARNRVDPELAETAGLVARSQEGRGYYDRFRGRLVFPIRNLAGETIAFGGRVLPSEAPVDPEKKVAKYINSPDTPVYKKGETLFGLYEARPALRETGFAVVVEGNVDVLQVSQAGIRNVVAPMGTALTAEQALLLRRLVPRAVFVYDGDRAGRAAALKAVPVAFTAGLQAAVVALPAGEDPDTFVKGRGGDALRALVERAVPGWDHLVESVLEELAVRHDPGAGIPRAIDRLAPVLDAIDDRRERLLAERRLADGLGLSERDLRDFLKEARKRSAGRQVDPAAVAPPPRTLAPPPPDGEWKLLFLFLMSPSCRLRFTGQDGRRWLTSPSVLRALDRLDDLDPDGAGLDAVAFAAGLEDEALKERLHGLLAGPPEVEDWNEAYGQLVRGLHRTWLRRRSSELNREMHAADQKGDYATVDRLTREKRELESQTEARGASGGHGWPS